MGDKDSHNSKNKHMIPQQRYLTDDLIIEEILTRLPVKSVLRFKSVSKQWYSTLSSSNFANAHLIKSPFSHPFAHVNTLFIMDCSSCYVFSYDDQFSGNFEDNLFELDPRFSIKQDNLVLTGSCNGLICLTSPSAEYFILWNPATRNLKKYPPHGYIKYFHKASDVYVASGFGYASSVDDYKYVGILTAYEEDKIRDCIVCIFSLKENKWRKIDFGNDDHLCVFGQGLLVNEKLYWYAYSEEAGDLLVSFDLGVERFDVIYNMDLDKSDLLGVMSGCLSMLICNELSDVMHILEPPAIVKSFELPEGLILDEESEMIGFTKTGNFFVTGPSGHKVRGSNRMLGIVDTSTRPMKYKRLLRFHELIEISRYVPSLISPFPIEEPSEG